MPRIFDNIDNALLPALRQTLGQSYRADFCVGYFNLRGWKQIDSFLDTWDLSGGYCCRLIVGMQRLPQDEWRSKIGFSPDGGMDNQTALRLRQKMAEEFRRQLTIGVPTRADQEGLDRLRAQLESGKLLVKLFLDHTLHAKLCFCHRHDSITPCVGYLGSSNLTFAGLKRQGELNTEVIDNQATQTLQAWFEKRWTDRWVRASASSVKLSAQEAVKYIRNRWGSYKDGVELRSHNDLDVDDASIDAG